MSFSLLPLRQFPEEFEGVLCASAAKKVDSIVLLELLHVERSSEADRQTHGYLKEYVISLVC